MLSRKDYYLFFLPLLSLTIGLFTIHFNSNDLVVSSLGWIHFSFMDHPHVFLSIFFFIYNFSELNLNRKKFFRNLILLIISVFGVISISVSLYLKFFAIYSIWHFFKQQIGWFKISSTKLKTYRYDIGYLSIVTNTIIAVLYYCTQLKKPLWFSVGDLYSLPRDYASPILAFILLVNFMYLAVEIYCWLIKNNTNIKSNIICITTMVFWLPPLLILHEYPYILFLSLGTLHSLPYLFIFFKTHKKSMAKDNNLIVYSVLACLFFIGILYHSLANYVDASLFDNSLFYKATLLTLSIPSIIHYYLESFYWKKSVNTKIFNLKVTPE